MIDKYLENKLVDLKWEKSENRLVESLDIFILPRVFEDIEKRGSKDLHLGFSQVRFRDVLKMNDSIEIFNYNFLSSKVDP